MLSLSVWGEISNLGAPLKGLKKKKHWMALTLHTFHIHILHNPFTCATHTTHATHTHIHHTLVCPQQSSVRHIACNLVLMANPSEPSESSYHKQVTVRTAATSTSPFCVFCALLSLLQMATKTGRAWLGV